MLATAPSPNAPSISLLTKYEVLEKIGEGTYGVVYLARSREAHRRLYAIKTFKSGREGDGVNSTAIREILLLRELRHINIVTLDSVHIHRAEPSLSLIFDYAEHDLYEMVRYHRDKGGLMDQYVVKSVMWQLLNGLNYLHQNWIIHRDLKPSNVLVMGDGPEEGRVKIADFGLARFFRAPLRALADNGVVVTIWYRAPELLLGAKHYTRAVDVWAAACIFGELLMLRPLFQGVERKIGSAPFQADQLDKIFRVMGHPGGRSSSWQHLEHLDHWHDNTENVRLARPEHPKTVRLADTVLEAMQSECDKSAAGATGAPSAAGGPGAAAAAGRVGSSGGSTIPTNCLPTPLAFELMALMLEFDPSKRITAADALHHPYFTSDPKPGPDVFVMQGKQRVAAYPRRVKQRAVTPQPQADRSAGPPPPTAAGSAPALVAPRAAGFAPAAAAVGGLANRFRDNNRKRKAPGFR